MRTAAGSNGQAAVNGWLADRQQHLGRDHGPPGLGLAAIDCSTADRLPGDGARAAGDFEDAHRAGRAAAVDRAGHPDEGARRRRPQLPLPDGEDAAKTRRRVAATRYPPRGHAQLRPVRALLYGGADYPQRANDTIVRLAMIETAQALDNLDDILSVEGLDASSSARRTCRCARLPAGVRRRRPGGAAQAIEHILARAKAHGVVGRHPQRRARGRRAARIAKGCQLRRRGLGRAAAGRRHAAAAGARCAPADRQRPRLGGY